MPDQTMMSPNMAQVPAPAGKYPLWVAITAAVILALHFVYDFAIYTGTVPQSSVPLITIALFIIELVLVVYLLTKKRWIGFLFLVLMALNVYTNIPLVKFSVTHTAAQKALQGDTTATKNLSPDEGLQVLNQEALKINQYNIQAGKLWNDNENNLATMNNDQFHTFFQQLLTTYQQRKTAVDSYKSDYAKYQQYIKQGDQSLYTWKAFSASALACYDAQYNVEAPIIQSSLTLNYDTLTSAQKQSYYEDTFAKPIFQQVNPVCHSY